MNNHSQKLNRQPLQAFKSIFTSLSSPEIDSLVGVYRAEFTGPAWLRKSAGPSLSLAGLGGWWGKEFCGGATAVNLVYRGGQLKRIFSMQLVNISSQVDGKTGLTLQYARTNPFPWPFVIDELRRLDETCLLGMTIVNFGLLRKLAFPFLLQFQGEGYGL